MSHSHSPINIIIKRPTTKGSVIAGWKLFYILSSRSEVCESVWVPQTACTARGEPFLMLVA